jgi:hypothetical protein
MATDITPQLITIRHITAKATTRRATTGTIRIGVAIGTIVTGTKRRTDRSGALRLPVISSARRAAKLISQNDDC